MSVLLLHTGTPEVEGKWLEDQKRRENKTATEVAPFPFLSPGGNKGHLGRRRSFHTSDSFIAVVQ